MKSLRLFFVAALLGGIIQPFVRAQAPLPPFDLALTVNDGVSATTFLGWPLLFRGDAVLMRKVDAPFPLDLSSLTLAIAPVSGPAVRWPLKRVTQFNSAPLLGPADEAVRVVWLLTAEEAVSLVPGDYTATFSWAGKTSPAVRFSVAAPPGALPGEDEIRRAVLQSQTALYLGDTTAALAALTPAEARYPESIELLVQRAKAHVQRAEYREALVAAHRAQAIFDRTYPDSDHPPAGILHIQTQARAELFKARPPGARKAAPTAGGAAGAVAASGPLPSYAAVMGTATSAPANQSATTIPASPAPMPPSAPTPTSTATAATPVTNLAPVPTAPVAPSNVSPGASAAGSMGSVIPSTELNDAKIIADAGGQWAATATARTQYDANQYSATRATGAPNVTVAGNSPDAWCPATRGEGIDWLELAFAKPVHAVEVRVRQNDAPGAIVKIEAIEPDGTMHVWWEGVDPYQRTAVREIVWFAVRVPKTSYLVARVKVTLNLAIGSGYKEIDAVQLVAAP